MFKKLVVIAAVAVAAINNGETGVDAVMLKPGHFRGVLTIDGVETEYTNKADYDAAIARHERENERIRRENERIRQQNERNRRDFERQMRKMNCSMANGMRFGSSSTQVQTSGVLTVNVNGETREFPYTNEDEKRTAERQIREFEAEKQREVDESYRRERERVAAENARRQAYNAGVRAENERRRMEAAARNAEVAAHNEKAAAHNARIHAENPEGFYFNGEKWTTSSAFSQLQGKQIFIGESRLEEMFKGERDALRDPVLKHLPAGEYKWNEKTEEGVQMYTINISK